MVGPVNVDRYRTLLRQGTFLRVLVRGEDVTRRCCFADDTPGHEGALLYRHNARGQPYLDEDHEPSVEWASGADVVIEVLHA